MSPRGGFDELRSPDDLSCTITKGAWGKANGWDDETKSYTGEGDESERVVRVEVAGYSGSRLA